MPVFEIFYKPRTDDGSIVSVKELQAIPETLSPSTSYGMYVDITLGNVANGGLYYLIYDPVSDTIYTPRGRPSHSVGMAVINKFIDSWAYKSFFFTRNNVSDIVGTETLQSKIINSLKVWVLIALGLGVAFLVVRFGPTIMIRLFLPFAVLGALGRIGRSNKDE